MRTINEERPLRTFELNCRQNFTILLILMFLGYSETSLVENTFLRNENIVFPKRAD